MSDSLMLILILGPGLAFAAFIGFLTRNDPITARATEQIERQLLIRINNILLSVFGPVAIWLFGNNLFGAFLLLLSGALYLLREKYFPKVYFIKGMFAKIFGVIYLGLGALMLLLHIS